MLPTPCHAEGREEGREREGRESKRGREGYRLEYGSLRENCYSIQTVNSGQTRKLSIRANQLGLLRFLFTGLTGSQAFRNGAA